ncbi:hypothetical protein ACR782_19445 [Sphingobacterium spiritivorum]|uniref:hypothetical protein n=1 Tax=Sphingobacterium spiritivorum TaxID=258 RepID=UPI003DA34F3E
MKRKIQKIRAGVIALLLCSGTAVWGQSISNPPLNVGPSTSVTDAGRVTAITFRTDQWYFCLRNSQLYTVL